MIDEDMTNNILDDADPNFYFFEEDKFVKITDSGVCSEDLFDDFSFEYDLDLDEDKPLFLASNFIKYDDYYAPLFFIPILYSNGVIKRNNNCDILFNELLSLDFAENNINFLNFTKNDDPQTFYENLKKIDRCELSKDIFVVDFYFDSLVNYLDLNKNWKTLDEKINIVKSGNKFIYYPTRSAYYVILGTARLNRKILYISNNLNSYDLNLFNNLSLKLGREVYNKNIFDLNIEDERPILVMSYASCCLLTDEKFESLFDLIVIDDNLNLKDENYISLLLRSKTNAIFKNQTDASKSTIDNIRRVLSSFLSWLEDEEHILKNPVRRIHKIKTKKVVKEMLSDENFEVLRDNCNNIRDLAMIEVLASTGMRVGELVNLNIEDVLFNERECIVWVKETLNV